MIFTYYFLLFSDAIVDSDSPTEVQSISRRAFSESERNWLFREQFLHSFLGGDSQKHATSRLTASAITNNQSSRSGFAGISYAKAAQAVR